MSDRDGPRSNPYHLNPEQACEACIFGTGAHATWCAEWDDPAVCGDCLGKPCACPEQRGTAEWLAGGSTFSERYRAARLRRHRPCVDMPAVITHGV